jgi:hypothetical protein
VNNNANARRFELVHADNMDYDAWNDYLVANNLGTYINSKRMNSRLLSSSPYPWTIDIDSTTFVNDSLTENSVPAPKMNNVNEQGDSLLRKSITNIRVSEDGLISFDFMGGDSIPDAIVTTQTSGRKQDAGIYDLRGRRLKTMQGKGVFIRRNEDGTMRKYFK